MNLQAVDVIIGALIAMVGTLASPLVMSRSERKVRRYERMADAYTEGLRRLIEVSQSESADRSNAYSSLLEASINIKVSGSKAGSRKFVSITNLVGEFNQRTWDTKTAALISERTEEFAAQVRRDVGMERRRRALVSRWRRQG